MSKSIEEITQEINNFVSKINQDLQISPPSKLLNPDAKLGVLARGAILSGIPARFPFIEYAIEQNLLWEKRRVIYKARYPERPANYEEAIKAYQAFAEIGQATYDDFSPDKAARMELDIAWSRQSQWLTVKELAERIAGEDLPDIDPEDAIELGKTTPFSADQWYRGCTDRRLWE